MTIRKGEPWGSVVPLPAGLPTFSDDATAGHWLRSSLPLDTVAKVALRGGDLARTMGGGEDRLDGHAVCAPVDVLEVALDGRPSVALSHVVLRQRWWRRRVVMLMNAEFLGRYDVAPRSHPNDGRVDVVDVSSTMPWRARVAARQRARTGTHLPHPDITVSSTAQWSVVFERPIACWLDGVRVGTARSVVVSVRPDALLVYA